MKRNETKRKTKQIERWTRRCCSATTELGGLREDKNQCLPVRRSPWVPNSSSSVPSTDKVPPLFLCSRSAHQVGGPPVCQQHSLLSSETNLPDGLRQFSLTPHPNTLPQEFLEQQQAESAVLLSRCRKSRIIRFVGLELRLPDGTPHSFTPRYQTAPPPLGIICASLFTGPVLVGACLQQTHHEAAVDGPEPYGHEQAGIMADQPVTK